MKKNSKTLRYLMTAAAVTLSALLQAFAMNVFLTPTGILPSGFTGVARLTEQITGLLGIHFSTSLGMIALNVPVAIFCYRHIGKKFVIFSMIQVFLASFLLKLSLFEPLFEDALLNICFGGFIYGLAIVVALKGNASTAGTLSPFMCQTVWERPSGSMYLPLTQECFVCSVISLAGNTRAIPLCFSSFPQRPLTAFIIGISG